MTKRWLTTKEAEEYTGLCFKTLKKYWEQGDISAKKIGNKWLWDRESIDIFLKGDDYTAELLLSKIGVRC